MLLSFFEKKPIESAAAGDLDVEQFQIRRGGSDESEDFFHRGKFIGVSCKPVGGIGAPAHPTVRLVVPDVRIGVLSSCHDHGKIRSHGQRLKDIGAQGRMTVVGLLHAQPEIMYPRCISVPREYLVVKGDVEISARCHHIDSVCNCLPHPARVVKHPPGVDHVKCAQSPDEFLIKDGALMHGPGRRISRHSPEIQTAVNAEWIDVETDYPGGS